MAQRKKRLDNREQEKAAIKARQEKIKAEKERMKMLEMLGTSICTSCNKAPATEGIWCGSCAFINTGNDAKYAAGRVMIKQNLGDKLAAALGKKS